MVNNDNLYLYNCSKKTQKENQEKKSNVKKDKFLRLKDVIVHLGGEEKLKKSKSLFLAELNIV